MKHNSGAVYKVINTVTGKYYIGSTSQYPYENRMYGNYLSSHITRMKTDKSQLYVDMRKYGSDKFEFVVVKEVPKDRLTAEEYSLIRDALSKGDSIYNVQIYPGSQFHTNEARLKSISKLLNRTDMDRKNAYSKYLRTCKLKYGGLPINTKESIRKSQETNKARYGERLERSLNSKESHLKSARSSHRSRSNLVQYEGVVYEGYEELLSHLKSTSHPTISKTSLSRLVQGKVVPKYSELVGKFEILKQSPCRKPADCQA